MDNKKTATTKIDRIINLQHDFQKIQLEQYKFEKIDVLPTEF